MSLRYFVLLGLTFLVGGCATVVCGRQQKVTIDSSPPGATVEVKDQTLVTPATVTLNRWENCTVRVSKPGYADGYAQLLTRPNPWIWGNIWWDIWPTAMLCAILRPGPTMGPFLIGPGTIIDASTGAGKKLTPDAVHVTLRETGADDAGGPEESEAAAVPMPRIVAEIPMSSNIERLRTKDGSVWVLHGSGKKLSRIDPQTNRVAVEHELPQRVQGPLVIEGDAAWYCSVDRWWFGKPVVCRMDLTTGKVTATQKMDERFMNLMSGEGAVWLLCWSRQYRCPEVRRMDPTSLEATGSLLLDETVWKTKEPTGQFHSSIQAGFGAIWVTWRDREGVVRIDPTSMRVTATVPIAPEMGPMATGNGALWVFSPLDRSDSSPTVRVHRIDPQTLLVSSEPLVFGKGPGNWEFAGGALWLLNEEEGCLQWIEPGRKSVAHRSLPLGKGGTSLGGTADALWVAQDKTLIRIAVGGAE